MDCSAYVCLGGCRSQIDRSCPSAEIRSIGLSGQMHGFVPLAMDGTPACNALLWADTRGASYAEYYRTKLHDVFDRLLNAPSAGLTALILLWLKNEAPEIYNRTQLILFPKDYLRYRLTGTIATDPGDASASLLWNFQNHACQSSAQCPWFGRCETSASS